MSVKIEGLEEIFKQIDEKCGVDKLSNSMEVACALVVREAVKKAPKDTGELRRSIASRVEENDGELVGIVYSPLEYAPYIEYGTGLFAEDGGRLDVPWNYQDDEGNWHSTSGMKPQPFLKPALEENREQIIEILREGMAND